MTHDVLAPIMACDTLMPSHDETIPYFPIEHSPHISPSRDQLYPKNTTLSRHSVNQNHSIDILQDGAIMFNQEGELSTKIFNIYQPLQQTENNQAWRSGIESASNGNYAMRNNDVIWYNLYNMKPGGGYYDPSVVSVGWSVEPNYVYSSTDSVVEFHWHYRTIGGPLVRINTWVLDQQNPEYGFGSFHIQNFALREMMGLDPYFQVSNNGNEVAVNITSPVLNQGIQLFVDADDNNVQFANIGLTNPILYETSMYRTAVNRLSIENLEGNPTNLLGIEIGSQMVDTIQTGFGLAISNNKLMIDTQLIATLYDLGMADLSPGGVTKAHLQSQTAHDNSGASTAEIRPGLISNGHEVQVKSNNVKGDQDFAPVFEIPSEYLSKNKILKVSVLYQRVTGTSDTKLYHYLKLGDTKVYASDEINPEDNTTRNAYLVFYIYGTSHANGLVSVETSSVATGGFLNANPASNRLTQPIFLPSQQPLPIIPGISFSTDDGTETFELRSYIVEALN